MQITGREDYTELAKAMNDPQVLVGGAKYVAEKYPWTSAGLWWDKHGVNQMVDRGASVN